MWYSDTAATSQYPHLLHGCRRCRWFKMLLCTAITSFSVKCNHIVFLKGGSCWEFRQLIFWTKFLIGFQRILFKRTPKKGIWSKLKSNRENAWSLLFAQDSSLHKVFEKEISMICTNPRSVMVDHPFSAAKEGKGSQASAKTNNEREKNPGRFLFILLQHL